ncbi:Adenylyltransferase and sulfurtransferase MOCS3 [Aphelenchoides fujianensis]|nr:Adenylyltransferase and sulfurtransferase MOCS3 [Aphelenchoides fujianensis]
MTSFAAHGLTRDEIGRFSRQLILRDFGAERVRTKKRTGFTRQEALKKLSVLIVGAGGLGCPVAAYLAAAGVGRLGVVDHDEISLDNVHRQFLHDEAKVGRPKVESLKEAIERLNSKVEVETFAVLLDRSNALEIVEKFDVVADCSDNVATRYLVNDACILKKKPLVSGSALGWEGQLTTCPCYRCLFPKPPPPESVTNCSEGGVLGPITGVIGSMQALEVIKIAANGKSSLAGSLFHFDGLEGRTRTFFLRDRNPNSAGPVTARNLLADDQRISARDFAVRRFDESERPLLVDTRPPTEFEICHLPEALNIPLNELESDDRAAIEEKLRGKSAEAPKEVFVICHRGNDSQLAVQLLQKKLDVAGIRFRDVVGGLDAFARDVDPNFPLY